ncbi:hypothetical protein BHAOGJBA_4145 [Methylobacterium hispanicum]|uniref:Uncharacterized protein n=1 Tax=Methylobacterium hispanicum TaxID=270350 RepID=A0AAV4ZRT8_9HYPH|nr:hypothetical protein BHAOGJBA_4145 [Methylobacterium hispanicum]
MSEARSTARPVPTPDAEAPAERDIDIIARIGEAMHGPLWIGKTAPLMGETHQAVRRWLAGQGAPPPYSVPWLKDAARRHAARVLRAVGDETP